MKLDPCSERLATLDRFWKNVGRMADIRNDSSSYYLIAQSSIFLSSLLARDEMYEKLFEATKIPVIDVLTHKCLEL